MIGVKGPFAPTNSPDQKSCGRSRVRELSLGSTSKDFCLGNILQDAHWGNGRFCKVFEYLVGIDCTVMLGFGGQTGLQGPFKLSNGRMQSQADGIQRCFAGQVRRQHCGGSIELVWELMPPPAESGKARGLVDCSQFHASRQLGCDSMAVLYTI